uniref:Uncharacterized protein n=1 Tax=Faecalibaculum rodentium TaxID=1702221 RepID=A0A140DX67_9FIRM|nr:hypothetical protein AALO17_21100 [Faecalibaculum rodentium]
MMSGTCDKGMMASSLGAAGNCWRTKKSGGLRNTVLCF